MMIAYVSLNESLNLGLGAVPPEQGATDRASEELALPGAAGSR